MIYIIFNVYYGEGGRLYSLYKQIQSLQDLSSEVYNLVWGFGSFGNDRRDLWKQSGQ